MATEAGRDAVTLVPPGARDSRILICRCAPTVDAFIVVTARHVVLIDTLLGPATAGAMLEHARPFLRDGRTLLVVNTHADWDHCWGNQLFAGPGAAMPAPIVATRACAARFRDGEVAATLAERRAAEPGRFDAVRPIAPTILFEERLMIDGGDLTLELFAAPGHTADHLAIFIPEIGTLLAGDAAESPFPFAASAPDLPRLRATLAALIALRPQLTLCCHAPETAGATLLARNIAYFDTLEARCRAALAGGRGGDGGDLPADVAIGFSFEEAAAEAVIAPEQEEMYRAGHRDHVSMMREWLDTEPGGDQLRS